LAGARIVSDLTSPLVSTEWLAQRLSAPDIRVVDASWHMPAAQRDAREEFLQQHIPGAVFFDIDEIADTASPLPHMLPEPAKFASRVKRLGLGDGNRIIVYDSTGLFSAARVWWMFRVMGHLDVAVLDGGLPKWMAEGRPLDDMPPVPRERHFTPRPNHMLVRTLDQMRRNLETKSEQVIDARSEGRFHGRDPEPRQGLRSGHIPGSKNIPYTAVLNADGTMKTADELRAVFRSTGLDLHKPVTASCGSGVSAAILLLAMAMLGAKDGALYDGAWAQWGADTSLPVAT
jgi:thiosulfate/3-mercaptopyruvate sulfurtransferase